MTKKQIKEAKRHARKALHKKMSFVIPSLIRTVSVVSTVVAFYLLASDLSFDADHWQYGARTTPVMEYLAIIGAGLFGQWCGTYFLDQVIYEQQMLPLSLYIKMGLRRVLYPALSLIGMVVTKTSNAPAIIGTVWLVLMVATYFSIRLSEVGVVATYLKTWTYKTAIQNTRPQGPMAWVRVMKFHVSFLLLDTINILLLGIPGLVIVPYKRMTERYLYDTVALAKLAK